MILENTFSLIQEIKLKHLAIGAGSLATAGLAAHSGLLGHSLQNSIDSAGHAISHAGTGFKAGQAAYDLTHTRDNSNFIDRNISGLGGVKTLGKAEYDIRQGANNIAKTIANPDGVLKNNRELIKDVAKTGVQSAKEGLQSLIK